MNRIFIKNSRGVGLIELLVTLLLLSIALLTLTTLQSRSLQYNQGAYFRSQANILAGDILDRMRGRGATDALTSYNITAASFNLAGAAATGSLPTVDVDQWRRALATNLPNGQGAISCAAATNICSITILWTEINSSGQAAEDKTTLTYGARL
jgi:type IV pilus assembly protein PilV